MMRMRFSISMMCCLVVRQLLIDGVVAVDILILGEIADVFVFGIELQFRNPRTVSLHDNPKKRSFTCTVVCR